MCQYDTDAPAQGHPHPQADILKKIKLKLAPHQWYHSDILVTFCMFSWCLLYILTPSPAQGHDPGATVPYIKKSWCR